MANLVIPVSVQLGNSIKGLSDLYSKFNSLGPVAQKASAEFQKFENVKGPISLKSQIREAENEVKRLVQAFGELDPRVNAAAKRVAELKAISRDAADAISRFDFETGTKAFARSLGNVAQVATGVAGAFAFLDDNSKESLKTIKNLQAALSFSQGIAALGDLEDSFKNIGQIGKNTFNAIVNGIVSATGASKGLSIALASTGIGLLAVAIGYTINAISDYNEKIKETADATKKLKEENERLVNSYDEVSKNSKYYVDRQVEIVKNEEKIKDLEVGGVKNQKQINDLKRRNLDLTIQGLNAELSGKKGLLTVNEILLLKTKIFQSEREKERIGLEEAAMAAKKYAEYLKNMPINVPKAKLSDLIGDINVVERFGGVIEKLQLKLKQLQDQKVKAKTFIELTSLNEQINGIQQQITNLENLKFRPPTITILAPKIKVEPITQIPLTEAEKAAKELGDRAGEILSSGIDTSIEDSFAALGEALAQGANPFEALGKTLLTGLANMATALGKEIFTLGVIFKALKATIGNLGPGGKIAVGLALIAFGAAVRASIAKNAKAAGFAKGGYINGPGTETSDSIPARLSKGEYVVRAKSVRRYGRQFFEKINKGIVDPEPYKAIVNRNANDVRTAVKGNQLGLDSFSRAIVNAKGGYIYGAGTETSDSIPARLSKGEFVIQAKVVRQYGKDFFDKFNKGIPEPETYKALVNRSAGDSRAIVNRNDISQLGLDSTYKGIVNKMPVSRFAAGGYVDPFSSNYKALVNRFESNPFGLDSTYKGIVNRPIPDTPRVTSTNVQMTNEGGFMPYIAETKVSGQDLRIILSRADKRYSNVT